MRLPKKIMRAIGLVLLLGLVLFGEWTREIHQRDLIMLIACMDNAPSVERWLCRQIVYRARIDSTDVSELNRTAGARFALDLQDPAAAEKLLAFFLQRGVDIDAVDTVYTKQGLTALHSAALNNDASGIALLLKYGARPDARDIHDRTPLDLAYVMRKRLPRHDYDPVIKALTPSSPAKKPTDPGL